MKDAAGKIYEFIFRGILADSALDKVGRKRSVYEGMFADQEELLNILSINDLEQNLVKDATVMAVIYIAISAFENSVRKLISQVLIEVDREKWWEKCVSSKIRTKVSSRQEEEQKFRWHSRRGQDFLNYTDLSDLENIISQNFKCFEPYIQSLDWVKSVFDVIEKSRNVIMHSGYLEREDIERIGINIRDWIKQVGA